MNVGIILLAGNSTRFAANEVKQKTLILGKPVGYFSIKTFNECNLIDEIVLVIRHEDHLFFSELVKNNELFKVKKMIVGGSSRFKSVANALNNLNGYLKKDDIVLIHDGARPLISKKIIEDNILSLTNSCGVITAIKSVDSIYNLNSKDYVNRDEIYQVQTPQTFLFNDILLAYQEALKENIEFSDDGQVYQILKKPLRIVEGDKKNIKITFQEDLSIIVNLLKEN